MGCHFLLQGISYPGRSLGIIIILRYILLGILLSNLKMTWSIWEDGCRSHANTTPCYIRDFSLFGFWYWGRGGGGSVLDQPQAPSPIRRADSHMAAFSLLGGARLHRGRTQKEASQDSSRLSESPSLTMRTTHPCWISGQSWAMRTAVGHVRWVLLAHSAQNSKRPTVPRISLIENILNTRLLQVLFSKAAKAFPAPPNSPQPLP